MRREVRAVDHARQPIPQSRRGCRQLAVEVVELPAEAVGLAEAVGKGSLCRLLQPQPVAQDSLQAENELGHESCSPKGPPDGSSSQVAGQRWALRALAPPTPAASPPLRRQAPGAAPGRSASASRTAATAGEAAGPPA